MFKPNVKFLVIFSVIILVADKVAGQDVQLLKNISTTDSYKSSSPKRYTVLGDLLFFVATTEEYGEELWAMPADTREPYLVKDIKPGSESSEIRAIRVFRNKLLFEVTEGATGFETWISDGTYLGTYKILGNGPRYTGYTASYIWNKDLYFLAESTNDQVKRLWKYDSGEVTPMDSSRYSSEFRPELIIPSGDKLYLSISVKGGIETLWKSDNGSNPQLVISSVTGNPLSEPKPVSGNQGNLYVIAYDDSGANSWLWYINDLQDTATPLLQIYSVKEHLYVSGVDLNTNEDLLLFVAYAAGGTQLWRTNGTPDGTYNLNDGGALFRLPDPTNLVLHQNMIFFTARSNNGKRELFSTTGGLYSIKLRTQHSYNTIYQVSRNTRLISYQNELYYYTSGSFTGPRLYAHVLGSAQDRLLKEFEDENLVTGNWGMWFKDRLYFTGYQLHNGHELWVTSSDGDTAYLYRNLYFAESGSNPKHLTEYNGRLIFSATDRVHGTEVWISGATPSDSAYLLKDITPGSKGNQISHILKVNDKAIFTVTTGTQEFALWATMGTSASTIKLKEFPTVPSSTDYSHFASIDSKAFLVVRNTEGYGLWVTDGTPSGTESLMNFKERTTRLNLFHNGTQFMYFTERSSTDYRLWVSNGSKEGTYPITSFCPCGNPPPLIRMMEHNGMVFFQGILEQQYELWVANLADGFAQPVNRDHSVIPLQFTLHKNKVHYVGRDMKNQLSVWETDGTNAGTNPVSDNISMPDRYNLVSAGDNLFLITHNWIFGFSSLWVINKSKEPLISPPGRLFTIDYDNVLPVNNDIYFSASDGVSGYELWKSGGTIDSTIRLTDLNPGKGNAHPEEFTRVGNRLYFTANHPKFGKEVFSIELPDVHETKTPTKNDIQVFPNPANNIVTVKLQDKLKDEMLHVQIYDLQGAEVASKQLRSNALTLDLTLLSPAVYILRVNDVYSFKLVKH